MENNFYQNKSKRFGQLWKHLPSGIIVPAGSFSDTSIRSKTSLLEIKDRAKEIERIYGESGLRLPTNSGLGKLISNAKDLSDNWLLNKQENLDCRMFFLGIHLDRIADAILALENEPERNQHLRDLLSGTLNFFERERSKAKNVL